MGNILLDSFGQFIDIGIELGVIITLFGIFSYFFGHLINQSKIRQDRDKIYISGSIYLIFLLAFTAVIINLMNEPSLQNLFSNKSGGIIQFFTKYCLIIIQLIFIVIQFIIIEKLKKDDYLFKYEIINRFLGMKKILFIISLIINLIVILFTYIVTNYPDESNIYLSIKITSILGTFLIISFNAFLYGWEPRPMGYVVFTDSTYFGGMLFSTDKDYVVIKNSKAKYRIPRENVKYIIKKEDITM